MLTLPSGRSLLALDLVVLAWAVAWTVAGMFVAEAVAELTGLTGAFRAVGGAIGGVGETLGSIDVPLIGEPLDRASGAVGDAGRDIVARGEATRAEIQRAAVLIGAAVALIPILTVLLPYAPARFARALEATALRRLVAADAGEENTQLERFLAERALSQVSYRRLRKLGERPWELATAGMRRALAEEELRRLGVSPRGLAVADPFRPPAEEGDLPRD